MTASINIQSEKASILLIYTGGTIGMIENPETGVLESFNFQHLKDNMPVSGVTGYTVSDHSVQSALVLSGWCRVMDESIRLLQTISGSLTNLRSALMIRTISLHL